MLRHKSTTALTKLSQYELFSFYKLITYAANSALSCTFNIYEQQKISSVFISL